MGIVIFHVDFDKLCTIKYRGTTAEAKKTLSNTNEMKDIMYRLADTDGRMLVTDEKYNDNNNTLPTN